MNNTKLYYVCIRKKDNKIVVCTGKTSVRSFTGVSSDTLRRNNNSTIYENKEYIIYIGVELLNRNNKSCCIIHKKMKQRKTVNNLSKNNDLPHFRTADTAKEHDLPPLIGNIECDLF